MFLKFVMPNFKKQFVSLCVCVCFFIANSFTYKKIYLYVCIRAGSNYVIVIEIAIDYAKMV